MLVAPAAFAAGPFVANPDVQNHVSGDASAFTWAEGAHVDTKAQTNVRGNTGVSFTSENTSATAKGGFVTGAKSHTWDNDAASSRIESGAGSAGFVDARGANGGASDLRSSVLNQANSTAFANGARPGQSTHQSALSTQSRGQIDGSTNSDRAYRNGAEEDFQSDFSARFESENATRDNTGKAEISSAGGAYGESQYTDGSNPDADGSESRILGHVSESAFAETGESNNPYDGGSDDNSNRTRSSHDLSGQIRHDAPDDYALASFEGQANSHDWGANSASSFSGTEFKAHVDWDDAPSGGNF